MSEINKAKDPIVDQNAKTYRRAFGHFTLWGHPRTMSNYHHGLAQTTQSIRLQSWKLFLDDPLLGARVHDRLGAPVGAEND